MSGPWDRPSSGDPDAQWPSEDSGQSSGSGAARDPGSEGAPGWDDWPSAPPPTDDYLIEEPLPPSSDPWAESWTQEEADEMLRAASGEPPDQAEPAWPEPARPEPRPEPQPEHAPHPETMRPADPGPEPEPEPEPQPGWGAELERAPSRFDLSEVGPEPEARPRVEPWSPEPDPWRFEPEPLRPEPEDVAPMLQPEPGPEPEPEPEREPEPEFEPDPGRSAGWPARSEVLPDWLAAPTAGSEAEAEAAPPEQAPVESPVEPSKDADREPEPESIAPAADPAPGIEQPPGAASSSLLDSILPWRSRRRQPEEAPILAASDEPSAEAPAEPEPASEPAWPDGGGTGLEVDESAADGVAASTAPEPMESFEPRWPASVPEPSPEEESEASHDLDAKPETPAFVPIGGGLTYRRPEPEPEPEPDPWVATVVPAAEPDARAATWPETDWADRGESTRVLPTDWTASQPEPPHTGELEPTAGAVRTRLAEPDTDEDLDEEMAAPTIAEQAVPWLIGVILLLAGMVIVLLALIFAGDGSLGGGSASSPSPTIDPTLTAGGPVGEPSATSVASDTPAPTSSEAATPTPAPTASPEPGLEYGPLEMVYQGRSAALAPIFLLRRDFTLEQDAAVLAQDATFDVRRFAWAPDGTVGAGLLADILVSIEPGQEKRRLGDGLSTITFGDDASTVYAVRITEDGADDSATVLAIDFASGDAEELANVNYERPEIGSEAALPDARFSDDGGAVRLYWMANDTLRLWVFGAGAWTITPGDGEVSELDDDVLPTLVAPNGRERVEIAESDGVTTLTRRDMNDRPLDRIEIDGMVSHLRWSPGGDRVVFTLGRSASGGGILQDLFLWDLDQDEDPTQLTATGAAFGAEWLGTQPRWRE